jgi:hypothetical protein
MGEDAGLPPETASDYALKASKARSIGRSLNKNSRAMMTEEDRHQKQTARMTNGSRQVR